MKRPLIGVLAAFTVLAVGCSTSDTTKTVTSTAAPTTTVAAPTTTAGTATTVTTAGTATTVTTAAPAPKASNPFTGTAAFCTAPAGGPPVGLAATGTGVTADAITLVHVRSQLENIPAPLTPKVGDPKDIVEVLVGEINKCGGINGRKVDLKLVEFDTQKADTLEKVCVAATEDNKAFGIISGTGWGGPTVSCAAAKAVIVSSTGVPEADYAAAEGRLITADIPQEVSLRSMADFAVASKALDGKKIGVLAGDYNGTDKTVQKGLVDYLKGKGVNVASVQVIACEANANCPNGYQAAVENFKSAGVEIVFPTLNFLGISNFMKEAVVQEYTPKFFQSNFNSMASDVLLNVILLVGGDPAKKLYTGTQIIDWPTTGAYRQPGYKPPAFGEMCADTYGKNTKKGTRPDAAKTPTEYGMVQTMCSNLRIFARAAYDAGTNLTSATWATAAGKLGEVDLNGGLTGTLSPTKRYAPTEVRAGVVTLPCPDPLFAICTEPTKAPPVKIAG
jgi:hypothetical protein